MKKIFQFIAPFGLVLVIILFIYNIASHGTIVHPGKAMYKSQCAQCHGDDGEGTKMLVPPLSRGDFALKNLDSLPCWIKYGMNHPVLINDTVYDQPMYPNDLDDIQIANVINYMNAEYFKSGKQVNPAWVRERWKSCK